jgi:hypothetical protein
VRTGIQIIEATYGLNCNAYFGNATYLASTACNGLDTCDYVIPSMSPDPAPGCAKNFVAGYTCGSSSVSKQASWPGEAAGATASFTCP